MKLSSLKAKPVITATGAMKVGIVDDALVAIGMQKIEALRVRVGKREADRFVAGADVRAIGKDAVIVADQDAVKTAADAPTVARQMSLSSVLKAQVVTEAGQAIGTVADVDFDPGTRQILNLEYDTGKVGGALGRRHPIDPKEVVGVANGIVTVVELARPSKAA